ncbi:hypothetical protein [Klebsiella quasipneumoniae]|uniref:hypothetical protein n=1 Tax=Klebsiella quasipneumoniae TaxID=1463165 RepID=UPI0021697CCB|nr:hypothetical protein [Klebsiella quasipneumoniae]MCS4388872.1 hypothetical protein [Klebsiella quasipneumoniae subsp. similipneumoniae]
MADPFSAGALGLSSILGGGAATGAAATGAGSGIMSTIAGAGTLKNIAGGASLLGGILGAGGASSEAKQQSVQLRQQAGQLRTQANNVNASAQLEARTETDKARQAESTSLANAAASGANANSVSAIDNRADIAQQGELNNLTTLWNGEQQANQLKNQANVLDAEARATKKAGTLGALSSILGAGTSLYKIYG